MFDPFFALGALGLLLLLAWALARSTAMREQAAAAAAQAHADALPELARRAREAAPACDPRDCDPECPGDALEHALETAAGGDQGEGLDALARGRDLPAAREGGYYQRPRAIDPRSRGEREAAAWPGFGPTLEVDASPFLPAYHLARVGRKGSLAVSPDRFPLDVARHVFLLGLERALADACAGSDSLEPARWLLSQWYGGRLAKPGEARHRRDGAR